MKWVVAAKKADFDGIGRKFNISPYLARIIRNRDIVEEEQINMFLNGKVSDMYDPSLLKDADVAADIIRDAIEAGVLIRVIGDYDIDGVCASYILQSGISYMGGNVDVRIPDRIQDGYGINKNMITEASDDGIELIITCDNGISAFEEVEYAQSLGITVIVTDHHEVPFEEIGEDKIYKIPRADAVVNPKQSECNYPFKGICGAMVAYKLVQYMLKGYSGGDEEELLKEFLSFAAFATVGDVMDLVDENHVAVKHGLEILKNTNNIGMNALIDATGIDRDSISAYTIGFVLGPCVNATGRLDTAKRALDLFNCVDKQEAAVIAAELKNLNDSRKNMTESFAKEAVNMVTTDYPDDKVIVVFLPSCHESIAGIVAGRLKERFYKPSIVLTLDHNNEVKGSGRSIDDYDMYSELNKVGELFTKFGGHKMAAGMSLPRDNVAELRRRLNENCTLSDDDMTKKAVIDIPMPIGYITNEFIYEIDKLAPFGNGNPSPLFAQKDVKIKSVSILGKNKNVIKLVFEVVGPTGEVRNIEGIYFDNEKAEEVYNSLVNKESVSVLYQVGFNEYMGRTSIQLKLKDFA